MTYTQPLPSAPGLSAGLRTLAVLPGSPTRKCQRRSMRTCWSSRRMAPTPNRHAEIDVIAAQIGETPETVCGHYVVWRFFGPVQYRAVAIPRDNDAGGE